MHLSHNQTTLGKQTLNHLLLSIGSQKQGKQGGKCPNVVNMVELLKIHPEWVELGRVMLQFEDKVVRGQ